MFRTFAGMLNIDPVVRRRGRSVSGGSRSSSGSNDNGPVIGVVDRVSNQNNIGNNDGNTEPAVRLPLLYALCRRWAWPAVTFRCESHPEEASVTHRDNNGDTVLHWACFGNPPLDTVQALLTADPQLASARNHKGDLPIHGEYDCDYECKSEHS